MRRVCRSKTSPKWTSISAPNMRSARAFFNSVARDSKSSTPRAPRFAINSSSNSRAIPSSCFFAIPVSNRIIHGMAHTHKNLYRLPLRS